MEAEHAAGVWDSDALLQAVLASPNDAFIGSHTLTHLSRDELQASDCNTEDGGESFLSFLQRVWVRVFSGIFKRCSSPDYTKESDFVWSKDCGMLLFEVIRVACLT